MRPKNASNTRKTNTKYKTKRETLTDKITEMRGKVKKGVDRDERRIGIIDKNIVRSS